MKKSEINNFSINNGSLVDESYEYDLHCFFEGKILRVYLLLPGIVGESIQINIEGQKLILRAHFEKSYYQIFKAKILKLEKKLPEKVKENVLVAQYNEGILEVKFIREFST